MKKKLIYLILSLGLIFTLTACSAVDKNDGIDDDKTPVDKPIDTDQDSDKDTAGEILAVDAYDKFLDKYNDVKIIKFQLDEDHGKYYYKIKGYKDTKKYEMKIDLETGDITKDKMVDKHDYNYDITISRADVKKALEIVDTALEDADENPILSEWTLEIENNKLVVEVEIDYKDGHDTEITYDLATGNIIKVDD